MVSTVFYYIWNVLSLGLLSAFKVAVEKGTANAMHNNVVSAPQPVAMPPVGQKP